MRELGDPGSVSACGASITRGARRIRQDAAATRTAYGSIDGVWTGASRRAATAAISELSELTEALAVQLDDIGRALQDQATDLTDLLAARRDVADRARAIGLEIRVGRIEIGYGVAGEASAEAARAQHEARERLQAELAALDIRSRRRQQELAARLERSTAALVELARKA